MILNQIYAEEHRLTSSHIINLKIKFVRTANFYARMSPVFKAHVYTRET